jgi:hypothetical protein
MRFLKNEVESEERITMAIQGFSLGNNIRGMKPQKMGSSSSKKMLSPPQLAFLIVDSVKWHACSARGHIQVMLALKPKNEH